MTAAYCENHLENPVGKMERLLHCHRLMMMMMMMMMMIKAAICVFALTD
jgi:hypothetical protein